MNQKRIIILLITLILSVVLIDLIVIFVFKKPERVSLSANESLNGSYECLKSEEWTTFGFKGLNGEDLGEYKREYQYSFEIQNNIELTNSKMKQIFTFTNMYGYEKFGFEHEEFTEILNNKELTKTYLSSTFAPVDFKTFYKEENPIEEYLNKMQEYGYKCTKK